MKAKKLGIWIDYQNAHLMEFTTDPIETKTIESKFSHHAIELGLHQEEGHLHIKEQYQQAGYYKSIGERIRNYESVIVFGPTDAKTELLNLLTADHRFAKIKIDVTQTDKMTESQQHAFVKEYFARSRLS